MLPLDITGQRFGRLVAIRREPNSGRHTMWLFTCDCGASLVTHLDAVRAGRSTSCGCLRADQIRERSLTHGHRVGRRASRTLKSYQHAKSRCFNPNDAKFPVYGARGITMCKRWADNFEEFLADMGECPDGLTLDRIDVNGNYEPRNCRWATPHTQIRNKTNNVFVVHEGEKMILKDFANRMGVNYKSLHARMKYQGQSPHDAAEALSRPRRRTSA